jgi:hypothetical protein
LGIFYYRTPEARDRRVAKMLEEAAARTATSSRKESDEFEPLE